MSATKVEPDSSNIVAAISADGEDSSFASLGACLAEIRKLKGVTGYILRGNTSAMLDLAEPEKISLYASLSYQIFESSLKIAQQLNIAEIESVLVEGETLKVLFIRIGENKISVFMEKNASHSWIIKRILI
jgi:predicted regulator of Ras-like GTPase activity (Roadblock/LC7/MglB family)